MSARVVAIDCTLGGTAPGRRAQQGREPRLPAGPAVVVTRGEPDGKMVVTDGSTGRRVGVERKVADTVEQTHRVADGPGVTEAPVAPMAAPDGRRSRWTEHRRVRREELVDAAVAAVRIVGPDFSVDDVARSAGVSKTVIYRYFGDKDELVDAVLERISRAILLPRLLGELAVDRTDDRARLRAVIAAFVALIEEEPALYRFAYAQIGRAGRADLVAATEHAVATELGRQLTERLTKAGRPAEGALTWAYGVVGMVQLAAHWWSAARTVTATELVDQLTVLADGGLATLLPPRS